MSFLCVYLKALPRGLGYFLHQYQRSLFHPGIFTSFVLITEEPAPAVSVFAGVQV